MKLKRGTLLKDMVAVTMVAVLLGIAWNHTLLLNAWRGKTLNSAAKPATPPGQPVALLPLPAGLMQVKDFYDRKEALFIDARDRTAYAAGHIKGALALPVGESEQELPRFMERVPVTTMIVVYCNGYDCHDSSTLAERLLKGGYRTVFVFEGGYPEWRDAGYPIAKGGI
jgi:rhodanese-related sulfurtransferase